MRVGSYITVWCLWYEFTRLNLDLHKEEVKLPLNIYAF